MTLCQNVDPMTGVISHSERRDEGSNGVDRRRPQTKETCLCKQFELSERKIMVYRSSLGRLMLMPTGGKQREREINQGWSLHT